MRKTISSLFILSLLLLSLWAMSAWTFGLSIKESLTHYLLDDEVNNNSGSKALQFDLLESNYTIFGAKLKLSLVVGEQNFLSNIVSGLDEDELIINVDIVNGPLLFEKSGISLGRSLWRVSIDEEQKWSQVLSKYSLDEFPKATIKQRFDNLLDYKLPIESRLYNLLISGSFDPFKAKGSGKLTASDFIYKTENQQIDIKHLELAFNHEQVSPENTVIDWTSDIPELSFKYRSMAEPLTFTVRGKGSSSKQLAKLNASNRFNFKQKNASAFPLESGDLSFDIADGNLSLLRTLMNNFSELADLQNQSQWVLEEQSEVPEGQDKMWELQDNYEKTLKEIPSLTNQLLINNKQHAVNYALDLQFKNQRSSLRGNILPLSYVELSDYELNQTDSILSVFQAVSKVNLDKSLLSYVSTSLPIRKANFDLIYKQNKLLMR